jgi:hypothetical protein
MHTMLVNHARAVQDAAHRLLLNARLELSSFRLTVGGRNRRCELHPQFISFGHTGPEYSSGVQDDSRGFVGWLPHAPKSSLLSEDKLAFKRFCLEHGLPTPPHWPRPDASMLDFLVKPRAASSGHRIRGPFRRFDPAASEHALLDDEYYEQFQTGSIAKAWYWNDRLVCLDVREMPAVAGDGRRSMADLVARDMGWSTRVLPDHTVAALAAFHGVGLDEALPDGRTVVADFRYMSALMRKGKPDLLPQYAESPAGRQLADAGPVLWEGMAEETRKDTLWTTDAIFEKDKVWLLEVNCNPMVHPQAYFPMLEGLFGRPQVASQIRTPELAAP